MKIRTPGSGFTERLKTQSRSRRETLERMSAATESPPTVRNDLLPQLEIVNLLINDIRPSSRKLRKSDPAHIRAIATASPAWVSATRF